MYTNFEKDDQHLLTFIVGDYILLRSFENQNQVN